MMQFFTMRLRAPLASFVGPKVDGTPQSLPIPARSMITGLIGSALGLRRSDHDTLQAIQDTLRMAVVVHRSKGELIDYQTADLGKPYLRGPMWSSGRSVIVREGIEKEGTRIQSRPYVMDVDMTVVVQLADGAPVTAEEILKALDLPARPLGVGRMNCPPSDRIAGEILEAETFESAVSQIAEGDLYLPVDAVQMLWGDVLVSIPGTCDWRSRRHGGAEGFVRRSAGRGLGGEGA